MRIDFWNLVLLLSSIFIIYLSFCSVIVIHLAQWSSTKDTDSVQSCRIICQIGISTQKNEDRIFQIRLAKTKELCCSWSERNSQCLYLRLSWKRKADECDWYQTFNLRGRTCNYQISTPAKKKLILLDLVRSNVEIWPDLIRSKVDLVRSEVDLVIFKVDLVIFKVDLVRSEADLVRSVVDLVRSEVDLVRSRQNQDLVRSGNLIWPDLTRSTFFSRATAWKKPCSVNPLVLVILTNSNLVRTLNILKSIRMI